MIQLRLDGSLEPPPAPHGRVRRGDVVMASTRLHADGACVLPALLRRAVVSILLHAAADNLRRQARRSDFARLWLSR